VTNGGDKDLSAAAEIFFIVIGVTIFGGGIGFVALQFAFSFPIYLSACIAFGVAAVHAFAICMTKTLRKPIAIRDRIPLFLAIGAF